MSQRVITNSFHIQKNFPETYEDFFTRSNLIISCANVYNRWNITHTAGIKRKICQKLPTKMYMGINIREDKEIHFTEYKEFNPIDKEFTYVDNMKIIQGTTMYEKMIDTIRKMLDSNGIENGVDIMILSETQIGVGAAISTIQALLISLAIHLLWGKVMPEQLEESQKYDDLFKNKIYKSICDMAVNMLASITGIDPADINQSILFTAMIDNGNMCQTFPNEEFLEKSNPKLVRIGNNICHDQNFPIIREILDFSILSFWSSFNEFYNGDTYMQAQKDYDKINAYYMTGEKNPNIFEDYVNFLFAKIMEAGKYMLANPTNEQTINIFLDQISKLWSQQVLIEDYMDVYRDIVSTFKKQRIFNNERMGLIPISSGKPWGTFLCVTKAQTSRETIKNVIEEMMRHGYTTINTIYMSWEDGISIDHPIIEQYLDKNIISSYLKENDAILECWSLSERYPQKKILGKHRELIQQNGDSIIFDCIDNKIIINNEVATHKEILTHSGTIEVIRMLFENMGRYINNTQLPASSYSKNKNEMVGKIILPLQNIIHAKFGEKLDLECTGSIVDFDLRLKPSTLNIFLLKKLLH